MILLTRLSLTNNCPTVGGGSKYFWDPSNYEVWNKTGNPAYFVVLVPFMVDVIAVSSGTDYLIAQWRCIHDANNMLQVNIRHKEGDASAYILIYATLDGTLNSSGPVSLTTGTWYYIKLLVIRTATSSAYIYIYNSENLSSVIASCSTTGKGQTVGDGIWDLSLLAETWANASNQMSVKFGNPMCWDAVSFDPVQYGIPEINDLAQLPFDPNIVSLSKFSDSASDLPAN